MERNKWKMQVGNFYFFLFFVYRFFSQQVSVGGRNKNKNKIHSDHFPIEFNWKMVRMNFILPIKMAISH